MIDPIADRTISITQDSLEIEVTARDPDNDPVHLVARASVANPLAEIRHAYGLRSAGDHLDDLTGLDEKWLLGTGDTSFFILPNGDLIQWLGAFEETANPESLVARLDTSVYDDPSLLWDAANELVAPATVLFEGNSLFVYPHGGVYGELLVRVAVSDGLQFGSQEFTVTIDPAQPTFEEERARVAQLLARAETLGHEEIPSFIAELNDVAGMLDGAAAAQANDLLRQLDQLYSDTELKIQASQQWRTEHQRLLGLELETVEFLEAELTQLQNEYSTAWDAIRADITNAANVAPADPPSIPPIFIHGANPRAFDVEQGRQLQVDVSAIHPFGVPTYELTFVSGPPGGPISAGLNHNSGIFSWTPGANAAPGAYLFTAEAQSQIVTRENDYPGFSFPSEGEWVFAELHFTVNVTPAVPPTIDSLRVSPGVITDSGSDPVVVTALGVSHPTDRVDFVRFWQDLNGNGTYDYGTDRLLGFATDGQNGWSVMATPLVTPGMSTVTILAQAERLAGISTAVPATLEVIPSVQHPDNLVRALGHDDSVSFEYTSRVPADRLVGYQTIGSLGIGGAERIGATLTMPGNLDPFWLAGSLDLKLFAVVVNSGSALAMDIPFVAASFAPGAANNQRNFGQPSPASGYIRPDIAASQVSDPNVIGPLDRMELIGRQMASALRGLENQAPVPLRGDIRAMRQEVELVLDTYFQKKWDVVAARNVAIGIAEQQRDDAKREASDIYEQEKAALERMRDRVVSENEAKIAAEESSKAVKDHAATRERDKIIGRENRNIAKAQAALDSHVQSDSGLALVPGMVQYIVTGVDNTFKCVDNPGECLEQAAIEFNRRKDELQKAVFDALDEKIGAAISSITSGNGIAQQISDKLEGLAEGNPIGHISEILGSNEVLTTIIATGSLGNIGDSLVPAINELKHGAGKFADWAKDSGGKASDWIQDAGGDISDWAKDKVGDVLDAEILAYGACSELELSLNFVNGSVYVNAEIGPGLGYDSRKMKDLISGQVSLPDLDPIEALSTFYGFQLNESSDYHEIRGEQFAEFGPQNVYFASRRFVSYVGVETVAQIATEAFLTGGAAAEDALADLAEHVRLELNDILAWLQLKGQTQLDQLTAGVVQSIFTQTDYVTPHIELRWTPVTFRYELEEDPVIGKVVEFITGGEMDLSDLVGGRELAADLPHAAFTIIWKTPEVADPLSPQAIDAALNGYLESFEQQQFSGDMLDTDLLELAVAELQHMGVSDDLLQFVAALRGSSLNAGQFEEALSQPLRQRLGLDEELLGSALSAGNVIVDLSSSPAGDRLSSLLGELAFGNAGTASIDTMEFNLSTFSLDVTASLCHQHTWGSVSSILSFARWP